MKISFHAVVDGQSQEVLLPVSGQRLRLHSMSIVDGMPDAEARNLLQQAAPGLREAVGRQEGKLLKVALIAVYELDEGAAIARETQLQERQEKAGKSMGAPIQVDPDRPLGS